MFKNFSFFRLLFSVLLISSIVTVNVSVAFADEDAPTETTPTTQPTEEPVDPATTEEPASPPVPETPTPIGTPMPDEGGETTPTPETQQETVEPPTEEGQPPAADEALDTPLFEQIPENTEVVVLDENGEALPLASEQALDVILDTDPMWCPAGVLPGGPGCTINFATISALLTNMRNNTGAYTQDGVIYFTANPGASFSLTTAGSSLGVGDFNTLNDFNLTLQGGWNGLNGASATFTGTTNFGSNTVTIGTSSNPWAGDITINNFSFNNVTNGNAITVYTTSGDVTLENVTVVQQGGDDYTAYLDSQSGDITVSNSSFDGNNSGSNRNQGFHAETNTGSITISDTTFRDARDCTFFFFFCLLDAGENSNGATLNAPTVTLNNVTAFNNDLSGIEINNATSVWINNVVSYNNGTSIFIAGLGSGVHVNGTGSTVVNVNGGTLSDNEAYGLSVFSGSISATTDPTCNDNRYPGPHPSECYNTMPLDTTPPVLSLPADITTPATGPSGAVVTFTVSATDMVDGSVPVVCSPASGSTFPVGMTVVNCSASDTSGNTTNGSFNVTVEDTTPPVIAPHEDMTVLTSKTTGTVVIYSAPATTDDVDGAGVATCSPASGSFFPLGPNLVTCTATDSHGNSAVPVTFIIMVEYEPKVAPTSTGGFFIPITGGKLIELECFTEVNAFNIKVTFHNLCDHEAMLNRMDSDTLPEQLPDGVTFAMGLNVTVFFGGNPVNELPASAGVQLDFPIPVDSQDQYAVLLWDDENNEWLDVTQLMKDEDLAEMLSKESDDGLYQIEPTDTSKSLYRILSTELTGTFVIVKK